MERTRNLHDNFRRSVWMRLRPNAPVVAVAIMAVYLGAHASIVMPTPFGFMSGIPPWPRVPRYKIGGQISEALFSPALALDRRLFPRRWLFTDEDMTALFKP
jgi:hypothetical protein